jgi:hypothetical protein
MNLSSIYSKRTLVEYKHAREENELAKEMLNAVEPEFHTAFNEYLEKNSHLKSAWSEKYDMPADKPSTEADTDTDVSPYRGNGVESSVNKEHKQNFDEGSSRPNPNPEPSIPKPQKSNLWDKTPAYRTIYREIVKRTHPDKITHYSEEERVVRGKIYLEATKAYNENKLSEMLYCAYLLNIPFEIGEAEKLSLSMQTRKFKYETVNLESTLLWQWYISDTQKREQIFGIYFNNMTR